MRHSLATAYSSAEYVNLTCLIRKTLKAIVFNRKENGCIQPFMWSALFQEVTSYSLTVFYVLLIVHPL